jgi:hypothetical protein
VLQQNKSQKKIPKTKKKHEEKVPEKNRKKKPDP